MADTKTSGVGLPRIPELDRVEFECLKSSTSYNLKVILAIADALEVLVALERAPEHHDAHPSHGIVTGAGCAHGRRVFNDTMPDLLSHIHYLAGDIDNELGVFFEKFDGAEVRHG